MPMHTVTHARDQFVRFRAPAGEDALTSLSFSTTGSSRVLEGTPTASDSDESWSISSSIFSTDDEISITGHWDNDFNDDAVASRTTIPDSDFNDEVTRIASIGASDARSGDNSASQQQHGLNVVTAPDSLGLHGSLTMKYLDDLDGMECALNKVLIDSSMHDSLEQNHMNHELERTLADYPNAVFLGDHEDDKFWRRLLMGEDNDEACSLSGVEHVDDLFALIA
ncbi:hypothetical protein MHU86_17031 [Fragilaria crotonensis]|nr:hypothetical protein MHU86_17031 [Fragilaria crotonensis]